MKIDVSNEKHNPLLKRKEIVVDVENPEEPTPSKAQLTELLTKHVHKDAGHIEIIKIEPGRGIAKAKAWAFIWDEKITRKEKKAEEKKEEEKKEGVK